MDDEDAFIVEHPLEILAKGRAHRVPWMIGVNSDEGLLTSIAFYSSDHVMQSYEKVMDKRILRAFGLRHEVPNKEELALKAKEIYFPKDSNFTKEEKLAQFTKLFSDAGFNLHVSHAISVQRQFSPVYPYYYSRRGGPSLTTLLTMLTSQGSLAKKLLVFGFWSLYNKITGSKPMDYGVCHSDELAMQFRVDRLYNVAKDPSSADYKFSKEMVKLWVDYAKDDTTLEFKGVRFPAQEPQKPLQYFEICETPKLIDEPFAERTDALKSLGLLELRLTKAE
jgi:carboxylesterase type B